MEAQINEIEELYNRIPQQVLAQLTSSLEQYQLPHQHLELSSDLDQEALNQLIKDLLEGREVPRFEFIVEGNILRGKLKSHILRYELTPEQTLSIQYIIAFPQLQQSKKIETDEWISSMGIIQTPEDASAVGASLYNGTIVVFSSHLKKIGSFTSDEEPLKSCSFIPSQTENQYYCLSGGLGQLLQVHLVSLKDGKHIQHYHISSNQHEGSVNSIAASPGSDMHVATGGSEGSLCIWQIPQDFDKTGSHNALKQKKKKVELSLNILPKLAAEQIHKGTIESLAWFNNQEVISASGAHEMAITDIIKMARSETILTRDSVVTSIDIHGQSILSAHEDGQLRMWDRREPSRPVNTYKNHSKWASSVCFSKQPHIFASGSYDRTVKIWDSRCGFPLQNLHSHEQKVLDVKWLSQKSLVSGGSDSSLHLYHSN